MYLNSMNTEHELSLTFDLNDTYLLRDYAFNLFNDGVPITDYYLDQNNRFRYSQSNFTACTKSGDKASGTRLENEIKIVPESDKNFKSFISSSSKLTIEKERYCLESNDNFVMTADVVKSPIKVGIIELEFKDKSCLTKAIEKAESLKLKICPLNAWNFNKRRIGIAGGPSSGKTSVAKEISLRLNHNYGANSSDVVEYATSFIQKMKRYPNFNDQSWICMKQLERENTVARTANIVLSDCPIFISYIYAQRAMRLLNASSFTDYALQSLYKRSIHSLDLYDKFYLLETINYRENGVRYHNLEESKQIFDEIKKFIVDSGRSSKLQVCNYTMVDEILKDILYLNDIRKLNEFISWCKYNITSNKDE